MKKSQYYFLFISLLFSLNFFSSHLVYASKINTLAPEFSLTSINDNKTIKLKDYSGQVIYLDFWASWCAPCRASFPLLNELHHKYKDKGFKVLAINLDDDLASVEKFGKICPVEFTLLQDNNNQVPQAYQVQAMPSSYIIDKKGNIRHIHRGFKKGDITMIEKQIVQLLAE
ncbi:MAG: TlpA disulfide reductase family protein [Pseudomonadota bacterium]